MKIRIPFLFLTIIFLVIFFVFYKGLQNSNIYTPNNNIEKDGPNCFYKLSHVIYFLIIHWTMNISCFADAKQSTHTARQKRFCIAKQKQKSSRFVSMKTSPKQVRHKVATHFGKLVSEDVALTQHDKNNFVSVSRNKNVFVVLCEPGLLHP